MSAMSNSNDASIRSRLAQTCAKLGLDLLDEQNEKLRKYLSQMQRWNKTYNLTAIRDEEQMLIQHVFDSLAAVAPLQQVLGAEDKQAIIYDVGSGGGLPGVVLAIMRPKWQVSCIDAVEKKTAFVRQMSGVLDLPNLQAHHARVEQLAPAQCDAVISRAFASLDDFATLAGRHVRDGGTLVAMKGKTPEDEILDLHARDEWRVERIEPLTVPDLDAQRCLVWMSRSLGTL